LKNTLRIQNRHTHTHTHTHTQLSILSSTTLNIEQAIETLSESSIRTCDVNIVEFLVQRIKSSSGTNSCKTQQNKWKLVQVLSPF